MLNLKTLAGRLFQLVFGWYVLLAIVVTGIQLGLEYSSIRTAISAELIALERTFSPSVADALWNYDQALLDSLAKGIAQTAIITGVKVENSYGRIVTSEGRIPGSDEQNPDNRWVPSQKHEVALLSASQLAEQHNKLTFGKMVLYSDRNVVLDRIKYSFLVILINSLVKAAGLWLIFYWAITWSLSRPLTELANSISSLSLKSDDDEPVLIDYPHRDEIGVLVASLNDMRIRLSASHRVLEQKVAERTQELEAANHRLEVLSSTDGLTGIANRRRFDEVLVIEWKRALRSRRPLTLLMLDVDLFKKFNDSYGHQAGDECLRNVAKVLRASFRRTSDLAARYGGEEFALIAADTDASSAKHLAEVIRGAIESLGQAHAESPYEKVTVSIGVATLTPEKAQQPENLIHMADDALYRAKNQGRNCVVLAAEDSSSQGLNTP